MNLEIIEVLKRMRAALDEFAEAFKKMFGVIDENLPPNKPPKGKKYTVIFTLSESQQCSFEKSKYIQRFNPAFYRHERRNREPH